MYYFISTLILGTLSALTYRWIGGAYIGGKAAENKWYNKRGITVPAMMLVYYAVFYINYPGQAWWHTLIDSVLFVSWYRLVGYDSYIDFSKTNPNDDESLAPIMRKLFDKEHWGSWIYDFTGLLLRFGLVGLTFFVYKTIQLYFTFGVIVPQYNFLIVGFAPAFIYWACKTFDKENPEIFDIFRTSKVTDPLDSNRFIQKDKDLAEVIIGFMCGLLLT